MHIPDTQIGRTDTQIIATNETHRKLSATFTANSNKCKELQNNTGTYRASRKPVSCNYVLGDVVLVWSS